jgi:DNA-binding NarL/FixJ family response regulator
MIFVTQESSADVVKVVLSIGAAGYVVKTRMARDLPAALDAVRHGRQFVSGALPSQELTMQAQTVID